MHAVKLIPIQRIPFFVGDNPLADIDGANSAGMHSVFIPGQFGTVCEQADSVCADYRNLTNLITTIT